MYFDTVKVYAGGQTKAFIEKTKNVPLPALYHVSKFLLHAKEPTNALSLGTGAGVVERDLMRSGWFVTCVDIEKHSDVIMRESLSSPQSLLLLDNYEFMHSTIRDMRLKKKYDYVFARNSLPFEQKGKLKSIFDNIIDHSNKGAIIVFTLFGNKTSLVLNGKAFSVTEKEIRSITSRAEIKYLERKIVKQPNGIFDVFEVIMVV